MEEKRAWKRAAVSILGKCRPADVASYMPVKVTDIHHQGCCLESETRFEEGQELRVVIDVPLEGTLYLTGHVRWSRYSEKDDVYALGIQFVVDSPVAEEACFKLYNFYLGR